MTNYYDLLEISQDATAAEIEAAIDTQYNHWRRLVTHHDPEISDQANRALRQLETIRKTLTNPQNRTSYDSGVVSGLTDPTISKEESVRLMTPPPPPPAQAKSSQEKSRPPERVDAWLCPECSQANAPQSQYCKKCGVTIGQQCPNCLNLIEVVNTYCPACGDHVPTAEERKKLQAQLGSLESSLRNAKAIDPVGFKETQIKELKRISVKAWAWMAFCLLGALAIFLNWHRPPAAETMDGVLMPYAAVFLGLVIFLIFLSLVNRAFSGSGLVAIICGLLILSVPLLLFLEQREIGSGIPRIMIAAGLYFLTALYCLRAAVSCGRLFTENGCLVRLILVPVILAAFLTLMPFLLNPAIREELFPAEYQGLLAQFAPYAGQIGIAAFSFLALWFLLAGGQALRGYRRLQYEIASAKLEKENQIEGFETQLRTVKDQISLLQMEAAR